MKLGYILINDREAHSGAIPIGMVSFMRTSIDWFGEGFITMIKSYENGHSLVVL